MCKIKYTATKVTSENILFNFNNSKMFTWNTKKITFALMLFDYKHKFLQESQEYNF